MIDVWNRFINVHKWFLTPDTISVDRTFARNELDAVYVDQIDRFIVYAAATGFNFGIEVLPLVAGGDALMSR